jgi:membrane protease YdiL (CAAX protease family)
MSNLAHSSFRNEARLYLLYVVAGAAAIPAGIVYAVLVATGWERWWTVVPLLAVGLGTALFAWRYVEKKYLGKRFAPAVPAIPAAYNVQGSAFGLRAVGGITVAASFVVFCAEVPNRPYIDQANSSGQGNAFIASLDVD